MHEVRTLLTVFYTAVAYLLHLVCADCQLKHAMFQCTVYMPRVIMPIYNKEGLLPLDRVKAVPIHNGAKDACQVSTSGFGNCPVTLCPNQPITLCFTCIHHIINSCWCGSQQPAVCMSLLALMSPTQGSSPVMITLLIPHTCCDLQLIVFPKYPSRHRRAIP